MSLKTFFQGFRKNPSSRLPFSGNKTGLKTSGSRFNKIEILRIDLQILESKLSKEYRALGQEFYAKAKRSRTPIKEPRLKAALKRVAQLFQTLEEKKMELHSCEAEAKPAAEAKNEKGASLDKKSAAKKSANRKRPSVGQPKKKARKKTAR